MEQLVNDHSTMMKTHELLRNVLNSQRLAVGVLASLDTAFERPLHVTHVFQKSLHKIPSLLDLLVIRGRGQLVIDFVARFDEEVRSDQDLERFDTLLCTVTVAILNNVLNFDPVICNATCA